MIGKLFRSIDNKDPQGFTSMPAPDCTFRFGNQSAVTGASAIEDYIAGFFDSVASLSHEIIASWDIPGGVVCHGHVTYTRHDRSILTVPFANILKLSPPGISDYRIFADTSQLY